MVAEALAMCKFQTHGRTVELLRQIRIEEKLEVFSDRKRLKQILINLLSNSIKFTYNGSVTITCKMEDVANDEPQYLDVQNQDHLATDQSVLLTTGNMQDQPRVFKFEVIDTGVGMS